MGKWNKGNISGVLPGVLKIYRTTFFTLNPEG
jgi:hypothetical protein